MSTSMTAHPKAETGRRIEFTFYRDLNLPDPPKHPGVITDLVPNQGASVKLRLDGHRTSLHVPPDYEGLTYLDEVTEVPDLPMGPFTPVADDRHGLWEKDGILYATIGEDGDDLVLITTDHAAALTVARAHLKGSRIDLDYVDFDRMTGYQAVFEWEPEDSEMPWTVRWPADGHEKAVHVYYLPIG